MRFRIKNKKILIGILLTLVIAQIVYIVRIGRFKEWQDRSEEEEEFFYTNNKIMKKSSNRSMECQSRGTRIAKSKVKIDLQEILPTLNFQVMYSLN